MVTTVYCSILILVCVCVCVCVQVQLKILEYREKVHYFLSLSLESKTHII